MDLGTRRAIMAQHRQDQEKSAAAGSGSHDFSDAGPPTWNRSSWEAFKGVHGFYPFGMQNGGMVAPHTYVGAPDWVYELMNLRKPPVTVGG